MDNKTYIAIDLKSFYASVECVARGLDPLQARLVVADESRTDKTICLAVSPALKAFGIPGRARLFEVKQKLRGKTLENGEPVDFIIARPRMAEYMAVSRRVVAVYESFVSPEDIHVYSVDEVFIDVSSYLPVYRCDAHELAMRMIREVLRQTGITATAGVGTNLYLAKVAMDIVAKHITADADGVRIAELDEMSYRRQLWDHKPITSFWRVGRGTAKRLAEYGIETMGQLARVSLESGPWLYKQFGVAAELLIDHAWGWEPCTIAAIKAYRPSSHSLSSGQVLSEPYTAQKARVVVLEMADNASMNLFRNRLVTNQITLTVNYDHVQMVGESAYEGTTKTDYYGRSVPKPAHGTQRLTGYTSSTRQLMEVVGELYDRIINPELMVRRLTIALEHVIDEESAQREAQQPKQLELFMAPEDEAEAEKSGAAREKERKLQQAVLRVKERYGKNALLRGLNYADGATAKDRNQQIGGHRA